LTAPYPFDLQSKDRHLHARIGRAWRLANIYERALQTKTASRKKEIAIGIISWIILGLVVGVIAKFLMPGKDPGGIFITT